ncbi:hypothetical protein IHE44_0010799, partial [Lamprotornis superbus]
MARATSCSSGRRPAPRTRSLPAGRTPSSSSLAWRARAASRRWRSCTRCSATSVAPATWPWRWWAPRVSQGHGGILRGWEQDGAPPAHPLTPQTRSARPAREQWRTRAPGRSAGTCGAASTTRPAPPTASTWTGSSPRVG